MCWNIWQGKNIDGVISHIHRVNPDIIGLQEITQAYPQKTSLNTAKYIGHKLKEMGQKFYLANFFAFKSDRHPTKYQIGNAILSRYPLMKKRVYFLSSLKMYLERGPKTASADAEPRIAVEAYLKINRHHIRVINTHLGVSKNLKPTRYTGIQMTKLMTLIGNGKNTILMGDFNLVAQSKYIKRIDSVLRNTDAQQLPTWPLIKKASQMHAQRYGLKIAKPSLLTHRIDQIFASQQMGVKKFFLGHSLASDHKSLIAVLEL
jgi:endonuclease/exonuclease/phosphatase family metal-dependent hydrolase